MGETATQLGVLDLPAGWEAVIGLEVHVQLRTRTKMFSAAPNSFGEDPNTRTNEVDIGLPGVLPVVNRQAIELGVRAALALGCEVHPVSVFARKHYFYPDLPKGYQISQYEEPFATGGAVPIAHNGQSRSVPLTRIHFEEDAAKSIHDDAITGPGVTHVNLNRAGVPLIEIVSDPAMSTPAEAATYLRSLHSVIRYLEVSDADMEKGHFRCDANVSVRRSGDERLGTRVEIKNLNSFRHVERALAHEIERQVELIGDGGEVTQETRLWDDRTASTRPMRSKEYADDYRYFPDPDLVALRMEPGTVESIRKDLPELPQPRRERFEKEYGLPSTDAAVLTDERDIADFFEETARLHGNAKTVSNWVRRDVLGVLKELGVELGEARLTPGMLAGLLELVEGGRVTPGSGREVLRELVASGGTPLEVVKTRGLEAVSDIAELESIAREVIEANPKQRDGYRAGQEKLLNFFVGQLMKRTSGKANPTVVREILTRLLAG